jgi:hypothetical protein
MEDRGEGIEYLDGWGDWNLQYDRAEVLGHEVSLGAYSG